MAKRFPWLRRLLEAIIAVALVYLGFRFFRENGSNATVVLAALQQAQIAGILVGLLILTIITLINGKLLIYAYRAIGKEVPLGKAVSAYMRRYFLSPFVPGGYWVAQYAKAGELRIEASRNDHLFGSTLFALSTQGGFLLVLVPALVLAGAAFPSNGFVLTAVTIFSWAAIVGGGIGYLTRHEVFGRLRTWLQPHVGDVDISRIYRTLIPAALVHTGYIALFWLSALSLGAQVSVGTAAAAYLVSVMVMTVAPLFQGAVLVEYLIGLTLQQAGMDRDTAIAVALIFRGFQFWLPVVVGGFLVLWDTAKHSHKHVTQFLS